MDVEFYRRSTIAPYPALRIVLLLCLGIWMGDSWSHIPIIVWPASLIISASIWLLLTNLPQKSLSDYRYYGVQLSYLLILIFFGAFWINLNFQANPDQSRPERNLAFIDDYVEINGYVTELRETESGGLRIYMDVESTILPSGLEWNHPFKTAGFFRAENLTSAPGFGDRIRMLVEFDSLRGPRNPHDFDFKSLMHRRDIFVHFWGQEILETSVNKNTGSWLYWRAETQSLLKSIFSPEHEPLARAIILGDRSGLDRSEQEAFSRAGLAHLMAVSGMHVGFLLFPVWFLLPYLWGNKGLQWFGFAAVIFLLILYAGITGFSISVQRASFMAIFLIYARIFRERSSSLNLLGIAGILILLYAPESLFEIGFQLSFTAVMVILLLLPVIRQSLPFRYRYNYIGGVYQFVMISIVVQAGLFPLLVHYFNEFSIIGPLANTVAAPLVQLAFSWTLVSLLLAIPFPEVAAFANYPSDWFFGALNSSVVEAAQWQFAWINVTLPSTTWFFIWAALFGVVAMAGNKYIRWKMVIVLLSIVCIYQTGLLYDKLTIKPLVVTVFDVGQGDAILIETPDGRAALYDAGIWSLGGNNSGQRVLLPELEARGISRLDAVILSHPHADHIGGVNELISNIEIETIYDAGFRYDSNLYRTFLETAAEFDVPVITPELGDIIWIGDSVPFFVLSPHPLLSGNDPNTYSIVGKLYYGDTTFLLTGDATSQTENYLAHYFQQFLDSDILKVAHHGSNTSSTTGFLEWVQPQKAVTSLGYHNRYNHPHPEAMQRLIDTEAMLYFTSLDGAVVFESDGSSVRRKSWR